MPDESLPTVREALAEAGDDVLWHSLDHADPLEPLLRVHVPWRAYARLAWTGRWKPVAHAVGVAFATLVRRVRSDD